MGVRKPKGSSQLDHILYSTADFLWSGCLVAPLVVTYWRGTWDLLEDWVYPDPSLSENGTLVMENGTQTTDQPETGSLTWYKQLTGITCYCLGIFVRIGLDLALYHLKEFVECRTKWLRLLLTWIYVSLYAIAGVAFWRGIWSLMTRDIGLGQAQLAVIFVISMVMVLAMKAGKSLLASPLTINLDRHEDTWANGNYFKKTPNDKGWFVLDVLFTNLVMRHLIVFSWWSLWELENQFFEKKFIGEIDTYVAKDSLLMGYAAFIVTYALDYLVKNTDCTKLYVTRPLYVLTILLGHFATVNIWRGLWSMLDHYFLPNINHDENYIISHISGLLLLTLCLVSSSIANDSIVLDSETEEVINIRYWGNTAAKGENTDEMLPIVE